MNTTDNSGSCKKNLSSKKSKRRIDGPSNKTRWAYWMQAIEPTDAAINRVFPEYHPLWVQHSRRLTVASENFKHLRKYCLNLTLAQAATYLRVSVRDVRGWENGQQPVPFMAFDLLRIVYESVSYRLSHQKWDGWYIDSDGFMVSPDVGKLFIEPSDFIFYTRQRGQIRALEKQLAEFKEQVAKKAAENTELRQQFQHGELAQELEAMQEKISGLLASIHTAEVIPFPMQSTQQEASL